MATITELAAPGTSCLYTFWGGVNNSTRGFFIFILFFKMEIFPNTLDCYSDLVRVSLQEKFKYYYLFSLQCHVRNNSKYKTKQNCNRNETKTIIRISAVSTELLKLKPTIRIISSGGAVRSEVRTLSENNEKNNTN